MLTRRLLLLCLGAVLLLAAIVDVSVIGPRVAVRWQDDLSDADRVAREQRYSLENGRRGEGPEWQYELGDRSAGNIRAIVQDPAAADTGYIDRSRFAAESAQVQVSSRIRFFRESPGGRRPQTLSVGIQSVWLVLVGCVLLAASRLEYPARRRTLALAGLTLFTVGAFLLPINPRTVSMGDLSVYLDSFESYIGVREVRFESHLSQAIAGRIYHWLGRMPEAPALALNLLMRGTTVWFVLLAVTLGALEHWSPAVVRYLALTLFAPSALMYFGYVEFGHLSLNAAAFPLLMRGVAGAVGRLRASGVLAGLGAALHGFGLLSLAGAWLAAAIVPGNVSARARRVLEIGAWGTAAYVGWIAIYLIALELPVTQGHADAVPWRPLFVDQVVGDRINVAIFSAAGARDLLFTAWVTGLPLLFLAATLWRAHGQMLQAAVVYSIPSILFTIAFWPVQGLGVEMDLVFAAFPAVYALAWVCAQEWRQTLIAAPMLASGHAAFWIIVLSDRFVT